MASTAESRLTASHSSTKAATSRARAKTRAARGRHGAGDQRAVLGPVHQAVDVAVDHHVDGVGPAGGQRAPGQGGRHEPDRRHAALGHHHGGERRDQQELDDPGLGQGDVGPDGRPRPWPGHAAPEGLGASMDMSRQPTTRGPPGTRRRAPVRLPGVSRRRTPTVSPSLSHRLDVVALVLTVLIVLTGRRRPPDRLGPRLRRLARVLRRAT